MLSSAPITKLTLFGFPVQSLTELGLPPEWKPILRVHAHALDYLRAQIVAVLSLLITIRGGQPIEFGRLPPELYCLIFEFLYTVVLPFEALRHGAYEMVEETVKVNPEWPLIPNRELEGRTALQVALETGDAYMVRAIKNALEGNPTFLARFYDQADAHRDIFLAAIEQIIAKKAERYRNYNAAYQRWEKDEIKESELEAA